MNAENDSRDTSAQGSNSSPTCRGRDARKGAHEEKEHRTSNNPPNHGRNTHGNGGAFLEWVGALDYDPPIDELPTLYEEWQQGATSP